MRVVGAVGLAVVSVALALGCDRDEPPQDPREDPLAGYPPAPGNWVPPVTEERAERQDRKGLGATLAALQSGEVYGLVTFSEADLGVRVEADIRTAPPGKYGLRLRDQGCGSPETREPEGSDRGAAAKARSKTLGTLDVGPDGRGKLEVTLDLASVDPEDPNSVAGKAVVLHSIKTTKEGRARRPGASEPVACGVVGSK